MCDKVPLQSLFCGVMSIAAFITTLERLVFIASQYNPLVGRIRVLGLILLIFSRMQISSMSGQIM